MDQVILAHKLESLRRCIQRVEDKTPLKVDQLIRDPDVQDILVLNSGDSLLNFHRPYCPLVPKTL